MKCSSCEKEIPAEHNYKCRICDLDFCSECSLDHFGLKEKGSRVLPKNIFKSILWIINKKFFRKD